MSKIVLKAIKGITLGSLIKETFKIMFDNSTNELYAELINGGFAKTTYDGFEPDYEENQLIGGIVTETDVYSIFFQKYYPFAYFDVLPPLPTPTPGITINSINTTNQTAVSLLDGSATVNTSGGNPPYEYSLDGLNYQNSNLFTGLAPGTYRAIARSKSNINQYDNKEFIILQAIDPPSPPVTPPIRDIIALSDAEIEIQNAYKRVKVLSKFGKAPSVITNGDFEVYDGQNWDFWVKYGNINVSRVQRTVTNNLGVQVPIENYAIRFNERAQQSRYIQHSEIPIQKGDTVKVEYRVGKTEGTGTTNGIFSGNALGNVGHELDQYNIPAVYNTFYLSKIRIKVGSFYLYNADYGNSYVWVNQVATVSHKIDNPQGDLSNYLVSFSIPEAPTTGAIVIQLFGFQKVQTVSTNEYRANSFLVIPALFFSNEVPEYSPIDMDNISASKSSQNKDNDIDGVLSISDNLRFYSEIPETKELIFGDLFYRQDYQQPLDNLYAIKYNGEYTNGWYEYLGGSSKKVPFGMGLAKSILTAYQKPFRKWVGSLQLTEDAIKGFNYMDIVSFNVPNSPSFSRKQFAVLGGSINSKTRQFENLTLVEVFDRDARSNDNTVPAYPDMPDPIFVQDPNSTIGNGIFTDEFTQEFN